MRSIRQEGMKGRVLEGVFSRRRLYKVEVFVRNNTKISKNRSHFCFAIPIA
jgi:hypothetical protein